MSALMLRQIAVHHIGSIVALLQDEYWCGNFCILFSVTEVNGRIMFLGSQPFAADIGLTLVGDYDDYWSDPVGRVWLMCLSK
jgi:hypothetical protein